MSLDGHIISTAADGRLKGMTPRDLNLLMKQALQTDRLVVHFHGGLVNEAAGMQVARNLLPIYMEAGAYPVFFVWRAGAGEILRNNLLEIAREELFEGLLRQVLSWAVGKIRGEQEGGRAGPVQQPRPQELDGELARRNLDQDPEQGAEPFEEDEALRRSAPPKSAEDSEALQLSRVEEDKFRVEVQNDPRLREQLAGVVAGRRLEWGGSEGARGVPDAAPVASKIDHDVLTQIADGADDEGTRGLISMAVLAKKALGVLRAVLLRFRNQTDSGIYPTVVEEVLRAFYLGNVGGALWRAMKQETLDSVASGKADRGGGLMLDRLAAVYARGSQLRTTLIGHSAGAVFIDNLLRSVASSRDDGSRPWPTPLQFQVLYLAPACTTQHFATTLDAAGDLIGRFRMFTMSDEDERADRLVGAIYPRSLLYLISGLLERDRGESAVAPVLGLSRYLAAQGLERLLGSELAETARLATVQKFVGEDGRMVLSPSAEGAAEGLRASALRHGDFDDNELVRNSLVHLIRSW